MLELEKVDFMDVNLKSYSSVSNEHDYIDKLSTLADRDVKEFEQVGIETQLSERAGSFILKDMSVINCGTEVEGVEISGIDQALKKHSWLEDYMWKNISQDKDIFTQYSNENKQSGYFIRSLAGAKIEKSVQACMHISQEGFSQNIHNIVIAEENSELHIINGCSTSSHLTSGLHVGVSEIYVKKGATLHITMIHDWGEKVDVRPRTVINVEEGGTLVSNYISLKPVGTLQMNPVTYLGKNSTARFNSVIVASDGCNIDVGSTVFLEGEGARTEVISRVIVTGGMVISRGKLIGKVKNTKAHLECKGLILNDGILRAIPELEGYVPGVEMSHEAAVGKIDKREIEYLMARGLNEDDAVSTIVRGFLNVDIEGLPPSLVAKLDKAVDDTKDVS